MAPKGIILYGIPGSPAVRASLMATKALGVTVEFKLVNLAAGEHKTPEYLKLNPQHTVPTLEDNGFVVWDSHAINTYLANQYGPKDSQFYPVDPKTRALIDQRLHFDSGVLFARLVPIVVSILYGGAKTVAPELLTKAHEAYDFLETFLANSNWFVGDKPTLADISLVASVSTGNIFVPVEKSKYPKLSAWFDRCKGESWYQANVEGLEMFTGLIKSKMA